jgi:hypothetical protein
MTELLDMACSIRCARVLSCVETRILNRILNRTGVGVGCGGGCGGACYNCSNSSGRGRRVGGSIGLSCRCIEPKFVTGADFPPTNIIQKLMLMAK